MLFIFGTHLFGLRRYAYKYMMCGNCGTPRLFIQTRGFAWGHLFWIPLVPLGYQYSWHCAACAKENNTMPTSFGIKLILLITLFFVFYMLTLGEWATNLGESVIWWQLGVGILLSWSIYETFNHFKKKEKNKYKYMLPLPDSEYCSVCDGELRTTEKGKLQCNDCKCFALGLPSNEFRDTEAIEEKNIAQLTEELNEAKKELEILEDFEKEALKSSK